MSKIDEVTGQVKHISFLDINGYTHCVDLKPTIQLLDQLRPYVELAEMIVNEDITKDIEFRSTVDYVRCKGLIQQIKEQSK